MTSDFSIPTTISPEAQAALATFQRKYRDFELPRPNDIEGWTRFHAKFEQQFAPINAAMVAEYQPTIVEKSLGGEPVLEITPLGWLPSDRVLVYAHGGGFALFSARSTLTCAVPVADACGIRVVSVDYTVAPHATRGEILKQVVAVIQSLVDAGHSLDKIAIFGDSAGGAIAASAVLKMRDARLGMPAAVVLWSPWSDITEAGDTYATLKDADPILVYANNLAHLAGAYAAITDQTKPDVSPVYADYSLGFPPTLIQVGTKEIFLSDAVRHYQALDNAGVSVKFDPYEGMWHVFQGFHPTLPESHLARKKMAEFLEKMFRAA